MTTICCRLVKWTWHDNWGMAERALDLETDRFAPILERITCVVY